MNKEEQMFSSFREVFNKLTWLNKHKMEVSLRDYKPSEVHCIDYVGNHENCNVTKLAQAFYMTRGAISKLTKKLIQKGVMESYQKPENKKEIYFKLTEKGTVVFNIHESLHKEFQRRDQCVYDEFSEQQFADMLAFAKRYCTHLDEEIRKQGITLEDDY